MAFYSSVARKELRSSSFTSSFKSFYKYIIWTWSEFRIGANLRMGPIWVWGQFGAGTNLGWGQFGADPICDGANLDWDQFGSGPIWSGPIWVGPKCPGPIWGVIDQGHKWSNVLWNATCDCRSFNDMVRPDKTLVDHII